MLAALRLQDEGLLAVHDAVFVTRLGRAFRDRGCRLVVGGRVDANDVFRVWDCQELAAEFAGAFVSLTEADFRADVSSSEIRGK